MEYSFVAVMKGRLVGLPLTTAEIIGNEEITEKLKSGGMYSLLEESTAWREGRFIVCS